MEHDEVTVLWRGLSDGQGLVRLEVDECWDLLGSRAFGRACFCVDNRVQVALTSYATVSQRIFFRAAAFGLVARRVQTRPVTLEVDALRDDGQAAWAVTATGSAQHVVDPTTLASLWTPVRPAPWGVGQEAWWIELAPDHVQGQRLRA